jgi:hypothetical protein
MKRGSDPLKVQQWTSRLERFRLSGLTVARFCRSEGVSQPSFYQWKRKLVAQAAAGKRPPSKTRGQAGPATRAQRAGGAASGSFQTVQWIGTAGLGPSVTTDRDPCLTVRIPGGIELALTDNLPLIEMVVDKLLLTRTAKTLPAETGERSC